jgi:hypothetical protein
MYYANRCEQQRDLLTMYTPNQHLNYTHFTTKFYLYIWPTCHNMYFSWYTLNLNENIDVLLEPGICNSDPF